MSERQALDFELIKVALGVLSPHEAAVLDALGPGALGEGSGDGPLGFGVETETATAIAAAIGSGVGGYLINIASGYGEDQGKRLIGRFLDRLGKSSDAQEDALTASELAKIGEAARESGVACGLSTEKASLVGDAIVAALRREATV